jgi:NADP-dependent 3-hydroxy acid dehydrogenase YdfG
MLEVNVLALAIGSRPPPARADDVARAVLFAITQPIELSIAEIAVQPARWLAVPA